MSLYNMLFGKNPQTEILLAILGFKESDIERFRDVSFEDGGIQIYTRTGGGNRDAYPNEKLTSSPYYLSDEDGDFDSTYATYHFKFPEEIKADCVAFKDVRENGISANFIKWVVKTLEREETENDKYHRLWTIQNNLVRDSKKTFICETNGHTIVPLNDWSLERYLELMEEADGKHLSYSVVPYKIVVEENVKDTYNDRVKIDFPRKWEIDQQLWSHWKSKFGEKFPKSIAAIEEYIKP